MPIVVVSDGSSPPSCFPFAGMPPSAWISSLIIWIVFDERTSISRVRPVHSFTQISLGARWCLTVGKLEDGVLLKVVC